MKKRVFLILFFTFLCLLSFNVQAKNDDYDSDDLSDYFGSKQACTKDGTENDCRNCNEYKFYLKMYDIYFLYKNKYNVKLDLPLIMATLYYNNEQLPTVFESNLNVYDRNAVKDTSQVTNLDWEYDYKNESCYSYLNSEDNSYDMQILAKNMVTKKITYKCSDGSSNEAKDIETSNYSEETLKCTSGKYDENSVNATYELDSDKYNKFLLEYVKLKYHTKGDSSKKCSGSSGGNVSGSGTLSFKGSYSDGKASMAPGIVLSSEPDPSTAINYWSYLNTNDFVYPKDEATGKSLGAWPKNYASIPTQLNNTKVYQGAYIWPATPTGGKYTYVYEHNGIDIMANFGTPIYSPVDGTLVYSTWGNTTNKGSDETAYSVTITPDQKITYAGTTIDEIFITHMSGIRYRCEWGQCNRKVKKGELLGFVGNAAGSANSVGWAPHVHMTLYNSSSYNTGLSTSSIEKLNNIKSNTNRKAGE